MTAIYRWFYYMVPANPLLVRIVHGGSRRLRHLGVRVAYLGVLTLVMLIGLLAGGDLWGSQSLTQLAKAGTWVFAVVSYWQIGLICLLAPLFMAGAISAEQSGKTFNILLTTPLSNLQIVLGSLMGRLYFVLALLASGLPLFAVLLIFGGVPVRSVFVSFGVAALSAIVTGSVAVTLAVLRAGGRKAVFVFIISIAGYLVACYAADTFLLRGVAPKIPDSTTWLTPLHPLLVLEASLNSAHYHVPPPELLTGYPSIMRFYIENPFEAFATITGSLSLGLIVWSATRLRAVGQGGGGLITNSWFGRWLRLSGSGNERRHVPREVWANPIAWREANTRGSRAVVIVGRWGFLVASLTVGGVILWFYHTRAITHEAFQASLLTVLLVEEAIIMLVAIYMSAGSVSREREDGTLDLLLTTPITPLKYLWGKLRGLVSFLTLLLAGPLLTVAMVSIYAVVGQLRHWPQALVARRVGAMMVDGELMLPEAPLLLAMMLVPFVACCAVVGISWSLRSKRVLGAVVWTVMIMGVVVALFGSCGVGMAAGIPLIGPIVAAMSPTSGLMIVLDPWSQVSQFSDNKLFGRVSLLIAGVVAALAYGVVIYSMLTSMVKQFDQNVRKLTGTG